MTAPHQEEQWGWWFRIIVLWVSTVYCVIGIGLIFGPYRYKSSASLLAVREYLPFLPWTFWGAIFLAVPTLLARAQTRMAGYLLGGFLAGFFALVAVFFTVFGTKTTNWISAWLVTIAPLALLAGVRYAWMQLRVKRRSRAAQK